MDYKDLTLALNHDWMPDEILPVASHFYLAPKYHPDKGIIVGSESGTCITLPAAFAEFRKTARLHEIAMDKLFLRATTIVNISAKDDHEITEAEMNSALKACGISRGNALLLRTGWGDCGAHREPGSRYIMSSPHLSLAAAELLAEFMTEHESDLLLTDLAVIGWPDKHLLREWSSIFPRPGPWPSIEAQMFLHLYTPDKVKDDFAVELALARAGVMTVRKLIDCKNLRSERLQIIVSPLHVVRGVSSTCRVIAVEE